MKKKPYRPPSGEVKTVKDFLKWAIPRKVELIEELDGISVGDIVTYTNDYGIKFPGLMVVGIDKDNSFYNRRFYLNSDAYWFPHTREELTKQ